jgi:hypothetical protein
MTAAFDLAFQNYRLQLINDYLMAKLGISYPWLIGGMKAEPEASDNLEFPATFVERMLEDVANIPYPNCDLIVTGFIENGVPVICQVNEEPQQGSFSRVRIDANFCATGSGASAAIMSLYKREHTGSSCDLMQALYHVYEAKIIGEVSPGVGTSTSITVMLSNGDILDLSRKGFDYMAALFDYFGPLPIGRRKRPDNKPAFMFNEEYFEEYEAPWERWSYPSIPINSETDQT